MDFMIRTLSEKEMSEINGDSSKILDTAVITCMIKLVKPTIM